MPIYEYKCSHCGVFETMQRITEAPLKRCPKCKRKVERLVSSTSFVLKGSGWYATDYGHSSGSTSDSAAEKSKDSPANGAAKPSDTPAATSPTTSSDSSSKPDSSGTKSSTKTDASSK